jgi:4-hydroxy-4-methyl-2-oxoglutarate aldolase
MLGIAKNRGVKGFVTDGFVRDLVGIKKVGIPCFSKGVIPNSPAKSGPGKVGTSIVIGGIYVNSGDIIVADLDGIVVVPNLLIAEVALNLKKVLRVEKETEDKVKLGIKELGLIKTIFDSGKIKEID